MSSICHIIFIFHGGPRDLDRTAPRPLAESAVDSAYAERRPQANRAICRHDFVTVNVTDALVP